MGSIEHINPELLHNNPAFTQTVVTHGPGKTVYIGGQNGVDADGVIVGEDMASQAAQAFKNLTACLEAAGAKPENIVKWTIYVVAGADLHPGFAAFQTFWGARPNPPTISTLIVAGLAVPGALIEIDAIAFVPSTERQ
ncbi:MAG: RidA family protein [Chloroflexota bacterium]